MPKQLLTANESSYETSVSGWAATGGTLQQASASVGLGTSAGNYMGAVVATSAGVADGVMDKHLVAKKPVTPGVEYVYREVVAANAAATLAVFIRWYGSDGAPLDSVTSGGVPVTALTATGLSVVGVAPDGAVSADLVTSSTVPASGYLFAGDRAEFIENPNNNNLLTYRQYSAEDGMPAVTASNGWDVARINKPLPYTQSEGDTEGTTFLTLTPPDTPSTTLFTYTDPAPVTGGDAYVGGGVFLVNQPTTGHQATMHLRPVILWSDAEGNPLPREHEEPFAAFTGSSTTKGWTSGWSYTSRRAPDDAAFAQLAFEIEHTDSAFSQYGIDRASIKTGPLAYELASDSAAGKVDLQVNADFPGATQWSVTRFDADGSSSPVRHVGGDLNKAAWPGAPVFVEDFEVPMGESVWYLIDWYDKTGKRITRAQTYSAEPLTIADPSYVWFKNPGLPQVNTLLMVENPISWSREARRTLTPIVNRANPVPINDVRSSRTGEINVLVWEFLENELLNALLDSGTVALIQASPGYGLPGNLYVSIGDATSEPLTGDTTQPGWRWTLPIAEVDRPVGGIQGTLGLTWQHILDTYDTWFELYEDNDSWVSVLTR